MPFPLLNLPTELRLETYYHLFGISPTTRLFLQYLPGYLTGCKHPYHTFEILHSALPTPHVTEYQDQSLQGSNALFYSETFFVLPGLRTINCLNGIGAQRRRCIRRLSIEYGVPESRKVIGNDTQDSMQALPERLMDVERVDVLELRIFSKLYTDDPSLVRRGALHFGNRLSHSYYMAFSSQSGCHEWVVYRLWGIQNHSYGFLRIRLI
ncbi:hypothetical protein BDV37DRAFT_281103 [Aspergillus pseudonomiae]|uniref:Uncharacterized protein n=1 Tax=Aspergillus pseudonomiae TaxID=1506151 RepID=A0A5N7DIB2_9EURO|nr:uncharacterized protein BDV37DRAFT_281103 [Aspergillus pseudonomiae]KAE8406192.1 hypothetical protein BDV37DRAFT_281103 [Aspergillus pseudonomiae]